MKKDDIKKEIVRSRKELRRLIDRCLHDLVACVLLIALAGGLGAIDLSDGIVLPMFGVIGVVSAIVGAAAAYFAARTFISFQTLADSRGTVPDSQSALSAMTRGGAGSPSGVISTLNQSNQRRK